MGFVKESKLFKIKYAYLTSSLNNETESYDLAEKYYF